jgi:hypothetical protein
VGIGVQSTIIDDETAAEIRRAMPTRFRNAEWGRLFQLSTDGSSYGTFFQATENVAPAVLVVRTDRGDRFGCYSSEGFKNSKQYYGTGETFVFQITPAFAAFGWTNASDFFVASSDDEIAIGGGGNSAIWIDRYMLKGFSEACPTFGSPHLASQKRFRVMDMEAWGIGKRHRDEQKDEHCQVMAMK